MGKTCILEPWTATSSQGRQKWPWYNSGSVMHEKWDRSTLSTQRVVLLNRDITESVDRTQSKHEDLLSTNFCGIAKRFLWLYLATFWYYAHIKHTEFGSSGLFLSFSKAQLWSKLSRNKKVFQDLLTSLGGFSFTLLTVISRVGPHWSWTKVV